MSTKAYDSALDFVPAKQARHGAMHAIFDTFSAIREGIELAGEYKDLTGRGMLPSDAARKVFEHIGKR